MRAKSTYDRFFSEAFGDGRKPYGYQCRLACGEGARADDPATLREGTECESRLIDVPTGLGKTAAVVLAWLWNRSQPGSRWPRRLVYCLPMRTLVEQTRDEVRGWVEAHGLLRQEGEPREGKVGVHILMGGEDADDWDLYPEENAILIGTQDMLLSRALNRGYGMSRYRWPMHFGLLNNDCLWVMDEVQLMGAGLGSACQLEAFRNSPDQGFSAYGSAGSVTWFMSATSNPEGLKTRDWRDCTRPDHFNFGLSEAELNATDGPLHVRRAAVKKLNLNKDVHFGDESSARALVALILTQHKEMLWKIGNQADLPARTLIICNTVDRAVAVHAILAVNIPEGCDLLLLHSRFRPLERRDQMDRLKTTDRSQFPQGQIVVSTQVIEAGVDISSGILFSEIAPLSSLVQRLGRLNRAGEFNQAEWMPMVMIVGVGVQVGPIRENKDARENRERDNRKRCLPYDLSACDEETWTVLGTLDGDASPTSLATIRDAIAASIPRCPYSLQRHELLDFFDTDANLSLGFTDVSPFVRGLDEDTDIQVLWRESWPQHDGSEGTGRPSFFPGYQRDEVCSVPISKAKDAREILNQGWIWRGKESGWISVRDAGISPGMTILLPCSFGGYDPEKGWTGGKNDKHVPSCYQPEIDPPDEDLLSCLANGWQTIEQHTNDVKAALKGIMASLDDIWVDTKEIETLQEDAVAWHDVGKNHPAWQKAVVVALDEAEICASDDHRPFGKFSLSESPQLRNNDRSLKFTGKNLKREVNRLRRLFRPQVAHEVASALAFRRAEQARLGPDRDTHLESLLAEYLIMSHHGRVRKVLRDEIPRFAKDEKDTQTVRGVAEGDAIPNVTINGQTFACEPLSSECRKMGRDAYGHESYTRSVLRLLNHYGPFRLAFFEAVFRAADARASARASKNVGYPDSTDSTRSTTIQEPKAEFGDPRLTLEEKDLVASLVEDGLSIQDRFLPEPLYKSTGKGHYRSRSVEEIQAAKRKKEDPS